MEITASLDTFDKKGNSIRKAAELNEKSFNKPNEMLEKERNLNSEQVEHMKNLFWEMHFLRKPKDGSLEPFDPQRIRCHFELQCRLISPWEYKVLMDMDLMYRATIMESRK